MNKYLFIYTVGLAILLAAGKLYFSSDDEGPPIPLAGKSSNSDFGASQDGNSTQIRQVQSGSAASQVTTSAAPESLSMAKREGMLSTNYRDFIHQTLLNPSAQRLRVAEDIESFCSLVLQVGRQAPVLSPPEQTRYEHRSQACKVNGGIDAQQRRALAAASEKFKDSPEFLIRRMQGGRDEIAQLLAIDDVAAIAEWGGIAAESNPQFFTGGEAVLKRAPADVASAAWLVAVCQRRTCDELAARLVNCTSEVTCRMSMVELIEADVLNRGLSKAMWRELVNAAGRRVDVLFPG